ncbi:hypothetical protein HDU89_003573 [Geranomyces variabilis]|nr:hypothetical protein HDU89_003573 [Geranomyces variabilis]
MDVATKRLLYDLQLQDLAALSHFRKGKQGCRQEGEIDPLEEYRSELLAAKHFLDTATSLQTSILTDAAAIAEILTENMQAEEDRRLALELAAQELTGGEQPEHAAAVKDSARPTSVSTRMWNLLSAPFNGFWSLFQKPVALPPERDRNKPKTTKSRGTNTSKDFEGKPCANSTSIAGNSELVATGRCVICLESAAAADLVALQCGDKHHKDCLATLVNRSTVDRSLMPPRCCQIEIRDKVIRDAVPSREYDNFASKRIEFQTPNPTYCSAAECSAFFVPGKDIVCDIGTCPKCATQVCTICKGPAHENNDCEADPIATAVKNLAQESGWRRCYQCNRLVELYSGW